VKLTKHDIRLMRAALHSAVEYNMSVIVAHCTQWAKEKDGNGMPYKVIPRGCRAYTNGLKREIAAWVKLRKKIGAEPE
jgi:hypothetical protein